MRIRKDLTGNRYGQLVVVRLAGQDKHGVSLWDCVCDCGTKKVANSNWMKSGRMKSCGCLKMTHAKGNAYGRLHGVSRNPLYWVWKRMMDRCYDSRCPAYSRCGARGITVCKRWHNPGLFVEDMKKRPKGGQLERISSKKGYSPKNCVWAVRII